jgi:peptide/nickel transport system substrate-binding protein/microcin C transport system substrate-binding protein
VIQDLSVRLETLKKGELSYLSPTAKQFALEMNDPPFGTSIKKVQAVNKSPTSYRFIGWNQNNELLKDRNVRWALSHLANIPLWVKKFEYNLAEPTIGPFSPKSDQHDPSLKPVEFSVKLARQRLAEAGWTEAGKDGYLVKGGRRFELTILFPTQAKEVYEPILSEYKNQAQRVGIDIQLRGLEWTSFVKKLDDRDFDAVVLGWSRGQDMDLKQIWHSESIADSGSNFISYKNSELDQTIDTHRKTMDYDARVELARKMQRIVYDDQPYTFLTESKFVLYAAQASVKRPKDVFAYGVGVQYWLPPGAGQ